MTRRPERKRRWKQEKYDRRKKAGRYRRKKAKDDRNAMLQSKCLFRLDPEIVLFSRRTARSIGVRLDDYSDKADDGDGDDDKHDDQA